MKLSLKHMQKSKSTVALIILIMVSLIYGSSPILIKKGLVSFTPEQVFAIRLLVPGIILLPFGLFNLKKSNLNQIKFVLVVALLGIGSTGYLFAVAQTEISSSLAGAMVSTGPVWVVLLGYVVFKIKTSKRKLIGIAIGLSGILFLLGSSLINIGRIDFLFALLIILAELFYALSVLTTKLKLQEVSPITIVSISYLILFPIGCILFFTSGTAEAIAKTQSHLDSLGFIVLLGFQHNILAFFFFTKLIQLKDATYASMVFLLLPAVATFWGFLDGESVTWSFFAGLIIIVYGVYLANSNNKRLPK